MAEEKLTTTLWAQVGSQPAKEPLHSSSVKLLPCHHDNHWAPSLNIKPNPNLFILNFSLKKKEATTRELHLQTLKFTNLPASLTLTFSLDPCSPLTP